MSDTTEAKRLSAEEVDSGLVRIRHFLATTADDFGVIIIDQARAHIAAMQEYDHLRAQDIITLGGEVNRERERCAKIAEDIDINLSSYPSHEARAHYEGGSIDAGLAIAAAIRRGE